MEEKVLFVDDDPNVLEAYQRRLRQVLRVHTAQGPHTGLRELEEKGPFAVVVADMNMPLMNGIEFLKQVGERAPESVRMMLTGNSDLKTAMNAVNEGNVFRFLTKPCPAKLMAESLAAGIKQYRLIRAEKELIEGTLQGTVELLTEVLSWVSPDSFGHAVQRRNTAKNLAAKLAVDKAWEIELAATLCQIGVLAIPQEILAKSAGGDELSEEEQACLESVPATGHELLQRIPRLDNVAEVVLYQNKCFDGQGYPEGDLAGDRIPIGSRILKAVNDYHTLRATGLSRRETLTKMHSREGWYDPDVLQALGKDPSHSQPKAGEHERPAAKLPVVKLSLKELAAGCTLASPILTSEGRTLVAADTVITENFLVRLRKYALTGGIQEPVEVVLHPQTT